MKKVITFLLALSLTFALAACCDKQMAEETEPKFPTDFANSIAFDRYHKRIKFNDFAEKYFTGDFYYESWEDMEIKGIVSCNVSKTAVNIDGIEYPYTITCRLIAADNNYGFALENHDEDVMSFTLSPKTDDAGFRFEGETYRCTNAWFAFIDIGVLGEEPIARLYSVKNFTAE